MNFGIRKLLACLNWHRKSEYNLSKLKLKEHMKNDDTSLE